MPEKMLSGPEIIISGVEKIFSPSGKILLTREKILSVAKTMVKIRRRCNCKIASGLATVSGRGIREGKNLVCHAEDVFRL